QVAGPTVLFVKHAQGNSISCTIMVSIVPTFPRVRAEIPDPHKMIGPMQQPQAQAPRTSPEGALPAATAPATNEGARAVAWSLYNKRIQRCGDSWFAMADHGAFGRYRIEIKDLTFNINSSPMTDVDKANGIEWKGG